MKLSLIISGRPEDVPALRAYGGIEDGITDRNLLPPGIRRLSRRRPVCYTVRVSNRALDINGNEKSGFNNGSGGETG